MSTIIQQPKPPFPKQHQEKPGIESELDPKPRYRAPKYKPAAKLEGRELRQGLASRASRAARGGCAGIRLLRIGGGLELHHRRGAHL